MKRKRKKWGKKKQEPQQSMIGKIIDLSLEDFEKELKEQKVNIGTMNNLILNLEGAYNELRVRKDAIIRASLQGTIDRDTTNSSINGIYAEMIKIEQKITYLKQRVKELIDVDKTPN